MLSAGAIFSQGLVSPVMGTNADAPIKLGVNGFGRIGRQVVRIAMERDSMVLKHINGARAPEYLKYLLEYDTVHGRFNGSCEVGEDGNSLIINGLEVTLSGVRDPRRHLRLDGSTLYSRQKTKIHNQDIKTGISQ